MNKWTFLAGVLFCTLVAQGCSNAGSPLAPPTATLSSANPRALADPSTEQGLPIAISTDDGTLPAGEAQVDLVHATPERLNPVPGGPDEAIGPLTTPIPSGDPDQNADPEDPKTKKDN